jgi:hypothetical protein
MRAKRGLPIPGGGRVRMRLESTYPPLCTLEERKAHLSVDPPVAYTLHKAYDHTT